MTSWFSRHEKRRENFSGVIVRSKYFYYLFIYWSNKLIMFIYFYTRKLQLIILFYCVLVLTTYKYYSAMIRYYLSQNHFKLRQRKQSPIKTS